MKLTFKQFLSEQSQLDPFKDTTDLGTYDDLEKNPKYHKNKKNMVFKNVEMSPRQYMHRVEDGFDIKFPDLENAAAIDKELAIKYADAMLNGEQFPKLMLRYDYDSEGNIIEFSQEGRHRAAAAEMLGIEKIPVIMVGKWHTDK